MHSGRIARRTDCRLLAGCGEDWAGLSLTMPLKRAVLPLLDKVDPLAADVGGADTVTFAGRVCRGHNTDVPGMIAALTAAGVTAADISAAGPALILGGGATACSALASLRGLGAAGATVAVRDAARAADLLAAADRLGMAVRLTAFGDEEHADRAPGLLISTVPAGAADGYAGRMRCGRAARPWPFSMLFITRGRPGWPQPRRPRAPSRSAAFELLLHQAGPQVQLMTGRPAPLEVMRAAGLAESARRASPSSRAGLRRSRRAAEYHHPP